MKKISFNTRVYLKPNGLVMVRVRWENKSQQCYFSLGGLKADPEKWNSEAQRARRNTSHCIDGENTPARQINEVIDDALSFLQEFFVSYELKEISPTKDELIEFIGKKVERKAPQKAEPTPPKHTFASIFKSFLKGAAVENNWGPKAHQKYNQVYNLLLEYDKKITLADLSKKTLLGWKEMMVEKGYHNHGINRHLRNIRTIARWADQNGEEVHPDIWAFRTKLPAPRKTVVYLTMEEIEFFYKFQFPNDKGHLAKARDLFIFMCCTSLRYSDMSALTKASMMDGFLDVTTQKTRDKIRIPLSNHAREIFERYAKDNPGDLVFNACSNQKLNESLKSAAEMAGLDREIVTTYYVGSKRIDEKYKLHELISCHVARKSFVSNSLALAIPPSVVMAMTGHSDYTNMLPYIQIGDHTTKSEMKKWDRESESQTKAVLLKKLEELPLAQLQVLLGGLTQNS